MADPLAVLLREAAEARAAGVRAPGWSSPAVPARPRARRLAPVLAAAAALLVVVGSSVLPGVLDRGPDLPPPPDLVALQPPDAVARVLGAPLGHTAGEPVPEAQELAVAPGDRPLRTVGVLRPRADGTVDRCTATYGGADDVLLQDACEYALEGPPRPPAQDLPVHLRGAPGSTWLSGTAPAGTAAVLLRAPGEPELAVAVAAVDGWGDRPRYVAWWPRAGTDVVAVDAEGEELARGRLPSDVPAPAGPGDPALGTLERPQDVFGASLPGLDEALGVPDHGPPPERVDVLARTPVREGVTLWYLGGLTDRSRCTTVWLQDTTGEQPAGGGGGGGCLTGADGSGPPPELTDPDRPLSVGRSFAAGTGRPEEQTIDGSAPAGTVRVRLESRSGTRDVAVTDSGPRWEHRAWFVAPWPSAEGTQVTAYDAQGRVLATTLSGDLDPRRLSPEFYATQADCLRAAGFDVTVIPQDGGSPAYTWSRGTLSAQEGAAAEARCQAAAERAVGLPVSGR